MSPIRKLVSVLGPGLISGASGDDPPGISTYSVAGASTGSSMLWVILVTAPMMAVVQGMCARIAMVTGVGLATAMKRRFARWILRPLAIAIILANTANAGADLEGMGASAQMLFHSPIVAVDCSLRRRPDRYSGFSFVSPVLGGVKWLTLALFGYIVTAFVVRPP